MRPERMMNRRRFTARAGTAVLAGLAGSQIGCNTGPSGWHAPSVTRIFSPSPVAPNPLVVPSSDFEIVWNKTVAVVDKYFDIESENRLARTIKTQPQMGATISSLGHWIQPLSQIDSRRAFRPSDGRPSSISIRRRRGVSWSKWRCTSSWKTWPNRTGSPPAARSSSTIFQSTARVRSWGPSPLQSDGSVGDETRTWSKPSWPASVMRFFCKGPQSIGTLSMASAVRTCRLGGPVSGPSLRPRLDGDTLQFALNVQYAPAPAIPIARIVGSSKAARWAGEFIHIEPMLANAPMAAFCRRAGPMTKWPMPRAA